MPTGQSTATAGPAGAARLSRIDSSDSVTLPVLVARKPYWIVEPTPAPVGAVAVFRTVSDGAWVTPTVACEAAEVTATLPGAVPSATAVFLIEPLSTSAWLAVYAAVQVVLAAGASEVAGQVTVGTGPAGAVKVSLIEIPLTVWLPEFVTRKE